MKCLICTRQARSYGYTDGRFRIGDPQRYPMDWTFCSRACQNAFHRRYQAWLQSEPSLQEVFMVDPSEFERAALQQCLKFLGEAATEIGFDKPLSAYSQDEALRIVEAIVTAWTEAMAIHHAQTAYPPVRGLTPNEKQPAPAARRIS